MQFSNDNTTWSNPEAYATSKAWTLPSGDGSKSVYVKFRDGAGNWSTAPSDTIVLDTAAPSTSASPVGGTYTSNQSVTLACSDGTGSGCDRIYYTTDGTAPTTSSSVYATALNISATTTLKYFATDKAGNNEAVKSQSYTIDTTPPTGEIIINGGATATSTANVTLALSASDASGVVSMQFSNDNTTWNSPEAYATSKAWTLLSGDGSKAVYVKYKDRAGNWSAAFSATIVLDTAAPSTGASLSGGTYNNSQSVTLTCADGTGSGCDRIYYTTDGTAPTTSSSVYAAALNISATTTLKYFATDKAGNSEAVKSQSYTINDTTPPTGTVMINAGAVATNNTSATLTLSCSDNSGACTQMQFSNNNISWFPPEAYTTTKVLTLSTVGGTGWVYFKFKDAAGNWSSVASDSIVFDASPPSTAASPSGGTYTGSRAVSLTCSEGTGSGVSGCDKIYYTIDGTTPTTSSSVYASALNISATTALKYFATDKAGNSEAVKSQSYTIITDPTPPTGTITINAGAATTNNTSATLTLTCTDNAGGCAQMQFSNNNSSWSTPEAYASTKVWTLTATAGTRWVYVKFKDAAGNWSSAASDSIVLDVTAPATSVSPTGGTFTGSRSVTLWCNDGGGSGCDKIYFTTDGTTPTTLSSVYTSSITLSATTTLKYFSTDKAGNAETVKSQTYTKQP
ncbi:chitobiase/beta-hexosaminidase C-terminal domain-containing protein [Geobacter sp.]|uniref:chitobiase/beta-hexosaminidase C-terminal domain-containing protein n=1 Tax=Geobacter sp. TaxID=46610 RepID=UPI002616CD72|nr:chitobiase/beta-hexosaminidase C-terminal domain-containing protein [Geobacter sp.]